MKTILVLDVGNTKTAVAVFKGRKIIHRSHRPTPREIEPKLLPGLIPERFRGNITRAVAASVVPKLNPSLRHSLRKLLHIDLEMISHRSKTGIVAYRIDNPAELGADRIASMAGALSLYKLPLLVIDSGTATTFDLLNAKREYLGGCILPGIEISLRSLADHTAKLKKVVFHVPESPVGKNTADHIRAGLYYGYIGTIQYLIREYRKVLGQGMKVIVTGGLSRIFAEKLEGVDCIEPDLLFFGLKSIAEGSLLT